MDAVGDKFHWLLSSGHDGRGDRVENIRTQNSVEMKEILFSFF